MTEGISVRTAEEIRENPDGSTLFDYARAKRADVAAPTNGQGVEVATTPPASQTKQHEASVLTAETAPAAEQTSSRFEELLAATPKDREDRLHGVLKWLSSNGEGMGNIFLAAGRNLNLVWDVKEALSQKNPDTQEEWALALTDALEHVFFLDGVKLQFPADQQTPEAMAPAIKKVVEAFFSPEFQVEQSGRQKFLGGLRNVYAKVRNFSLKDFLGSLKKEKSEQLADVEVEEVVEESAPVVTEREKTFLSKEQQKRYADRLRSISASVAAEMGLTLNKFNFDGNLANALSGSTQNEVIDSLGNDVLEGFFTPDAEGEFTQEQSAFIGEVINRLFDESHIADNEVVENAEMLSNRVFRLEQTLEKAITDSDAPARMKIEPELAQARAEFRALQSRSDAKKDDDKAETSSKKPFWQRFFPSKAPKPLEPMMQQVADSGPVVSEEEKERIIVSLRDEKESREREAELQRVDTEYVLNLVSTAIETGSAAENKHVQAVAEFMLRLAIETKNQLNLAPKQEAELRKHLERAQLHPNERHAAERPFESELKTAASEAIEKSSQTPGQKSWLRKALETAGIVVSGALASTALGAMGAGPESRMAVSSVVLLATAAVGDTTPGTFVRGTLVGLGENQNLPSWIRGIAQGASGAAHRVQDRTRTLFAFFGGMLGEATIELGARLLQEAAPAAQVAAPVVESASNPLTKASEAAVQNLLQQFAEARPLVESAPDQAASEVAKTIAGAARTFTDRLAQDPGQIDVVLQQAQTYFTPERVHAIAEVVSKFDPAVGPQMLTAPETAQLATNSQEAVQSITALMDQVSGMTTDQRAQQLTPWVNQITSVLKNFQAIAPAR